MMKLMLTGSIAAALLAAGLGAGCNSTQLPTAASAVPSTSAISSLDTSAVAGAGGAATSAGAACATGDGVNDACACDADARTSCSGFYSADWESFARANGYTTASWKYGLLACLGSNDVSTACTSSLARREALNEQMMSACASYCRGTTPKPGAEPCVDRLESSYASLNNACRTALDAHEAAKALETRGPF